jgi:hypothetical protein
MSKFNVLVSWTVCAEVSVEADTLKEAIQQVEDMPGLPEDGEYLDGSFEVNVEATEEVNAYHKRLAEEGLLHGLCNTCKAPHHDMCANNSNCSCCVNTIKQDEG